MNVIGLMSGTSMDGVDGVLARFADSRTQSTPLRILAHADVAMPQELRETLLSLNSPGHNELHRSALAAQELVRLYHQVVQRLLQTAGISADSVRAIGAHGQTVRHQPHLGYTWQLNAPALLAELTGIGVVADLRSADVAAGGQGAPLVPAFHQAVFGSESPRILLNVGGIANVTVLPGGVSAPADAQLPRTVGGFDTGPGNLLLDLWCQRHRGEPYDANGAWAASGTVNAELCAHLYSSEPWFALAPPKSTGRDQFHADWLDQRLAEYSRRSGRTPAPADVQATLVELTALSASRAIRTVAGDAREIYVCGGGAANPVLMKTLATYLPGRVVQSTAALGVPPQQVEALAFAWLARAHVLGLPGNLPSVTGARGLRVLGAWYPPPG